MSNKIYFKNLDGLRTIAALMVFFWHSYGLGIMEIQNDFLRTLLLTVFNGETGVAVFFVLSGFLITYLILDEVEKNNTFSLKNFYLRRILRIWPLYYGLLIFSYFILLPILSRNSQLNPGEIIGHSKYYFLFVSNFDSILGNGKGSFLPVGITWSVAVEEQFYLFWPLLFFLVPVKKYHYLLFITFFASLLFKAFYFNNIPFIKYHSLSAMTNLSVGGIAAYYAINNRFPKERFFRFSTAIYLMGFAILTADMLAGFTGKDAIFKTTEAFFFAFVILDQSYNESGTFNLSRFRWLIKMGKYTYGIYMLHMVVLYGIIILCIAFKWGNEVKYFLNLFLGLPLLLLMAYMSYEYFEKWFLNLKDKYGYRNKHNKGKR